MKLKIASYNISGGYYNHDDKTEYLDRERVDAVDDQLLHQIIDTINQENIDVICFQEIITTDRIHYIQSICNGTNLKYYDFYELSECNIIKDTNCGIAILSKYPIQTIKKEFFPNPKLSKTTSSGKTYYLYDKGYMLVQLSINEQVITLLTHHGFPYGTFNSTAEQNLPVFQFFDDVVETNKPDIITGDFNVEDMMSLMPKTKYHYMRTINQATTVEGRKLDDILLPIGKAYSSSVLQLLSDHFMVLTTIEL